MAIIIHLVFYHKTFDFDFYHTTFDLDFYHKTFDFDLYHTTFDLDFDMSGVLCQDRRCSLGTGPDGTGHCKEINDCFIEGWVYSQVIMTVVLDA